MNNKKQLAAKVLKVSPKKVIFQQEALEDITKAITRADIRGLIAVHKITVARKNLLSRGRARERAKQKKKGRQRGQGNRKGKANARWSQKRRWVMGVRTQRALLQELRQGERISRETYTELYRKVKGGFFRNVRHIKLHLKEYKLIQP